jgi:molybdopterin-guanine dinucleotide biosynthesis protein A
MNPFQNPSITVKPKQAVERTDLTGIIMAGGKSSRMGKEKGLVEFRGRRFIQYGIDLLTSYVGKVIISSSNPSYLSYGLEMVPDEIAGQGPAAGLASVLKKSSTRWNLVLACDLPFLQPELIDELLSKNGSCQAVIPVHQGVMEPLAGLYDKSLGLQFGEAVLSGNLALHKILKSCEVNYIDTEHLLEKYPNLFANFNSLEEMDLFDGK